MMSTKRPVLNEMPLAKALDLLARGVPRIFVTMSVDQWDELLEESYDDGAILLELDDNELPVKAYRRGQTT